MFKNFCTRERRALVEEVACPWPLTICSRTVGFTTFMDKNYSAKIPKKVTN